MHKVSMLLMTVFLMTLPAAQAAPVPAVTLTSYTDFTDGAWTLGFEFDPTANILVTSLGSFFPTGAVDIHGVTLWNASATVLATTTVTGTGTEGFDYTAITPVLLLAGQDYVIGANTLSDDYALTGTFSTAAMIGYLGHVETSCAGVTPCYPGTNTISGLNDFGANFTFTSSVPEPASATLVGAVLALLAFRRFRRNSSSSGTV